MAKFLDLTRERVGDFFTNWSTYDAPVTTKLRLTFRNRIKANWHGCCGNHGQPGC
jgi:hypothetical protein